MSCGGCGRRRGRVSADEAMPRVRGNICALCPDAVGVWPKVQCSVSGVAVFAIQLGARPCPAGLHPARWDRVRWLRLTWIGVPIPMRVLVWIRRRAPRAPQPGCGCLAAGKLWWIRAVRAVVRGRARRRAIVAWPTRATLGALRFTYDRPEPVVVVVKSRRDAGAVNAQDSP